MSNLQDPIKNLILLVEDDSNDQILIKRAFMKAKIINPIKILENGELAIQYILGKGEYSNRLDNPIPMLVLLDLKLPKKSGLEVLKVVKTKSLIKRIPIVVLTSSRDSVDINKAFDLGVNSYLVKPVKFEELVEIIRNIGLYWLILNEYPNLEEK